MSLYQTHEVMTFDLETASPVDLKACGAAVYAAHPETRILLFLYRLPGLAPACWDVASGAPMPARLKECLLNDRVIKRGANSMRFDTAVLKHALGITIPYHVQEDVLVRAARYGLPGALGRLCDALGMDEDESKDKEGKALISLFCSPLPANSVLRKKGYEYACKETHPVEWEKFIRYGLRDLTSTDGCAERLPVWNDTPFEHEVLMVDMAINDRGIRVDRQYVKEAARFIEVMKEEVHRKVTKLTGGIRLTQHKKFKAWLQKKMPGRVITSTAKDKIAELIAEGDLPDIVSEVFEYHGLTTSTSLAKFETMLNHAMQEDDRMYGLIIYCGAGTTGRWSGKGPQPHNFPRPLHVKWIIDLFIKLCREGRLDEFHPDAKPLRIAVSSLRGALIPADDHIFVNADFSSIEGRLLGWTTGEQWVLDAYRDGKNLYLLNGELFGHDYETMARFKESSDPVEYGIYMVCKVTELALGYAGGVGAFLNMAKNYGLDCMALADLLHEHDLIPENLLHQANRLFHNPRFRKQVRATGLDQKTWVYMDALKRLWRSKRPATVQFWRQIDECVRYALNNPGKTYSCGWQGLIECEATPMLDLGGGQLYHPDGSPMCEYLGIKLPSGRVLTYLKPKISGRKQVNELDDPEEDEDTDDEKDTIVSYLASGEKGLYRAYMHGGVFCNNVVQGEARDIMANALITLEKKKWPVVLHVHDQALAEVRIALTKGYFTPKQLEADMCELPEWGFSIPLKAQGEFMGRFAK